MRKLLLFVVIISIAGGSVFGQRGPDQEDEEAGTPPVYEPYEKDEFPAWMYSLRRAEVVFFGAFPITMLFSSLAYDGYSTVRDALGEGTVTGTAGSELGQFTDAERAGILIAGAALAAAVSVIDFILRRNDEQPAE